MPTADELSRYYASLSDEELREIDPAELTETARKCYQQEREKRVPAEEDAEPAEAHHFELDYSGDVDVEPDWLEHAACACSFTAVPGSRHAEDAARAQDVLLAAGIPCHLSLLQADPDTEDGSRFDEYRVLVPEPLNLKALSVLDREIFNPEQEADWRAHFAALSDQELAQLTPDVICAGLLDRAERLKRAFNDEIARRISK